MDYVLRNNMEKIEKMLKYTKLFNLYSVLLSESQRSVLNDYYFLDLSLSEISENRKISRSAVEDALKKGANRLDEIEEKLGILKKHENLSQKLNKLKDLTSKIEEKALIKELLEELDNGI